MPRQWMRYIDVTAEGGGKTLNLSDFRCRFSIRQFTSQTVNEADIRITNLGPKTAKLFVSKDSEFKKITVTAGYQENNGIVFTGNITQARYGKESPTDTFLDIFAADNDRSHNFAVVNKTFAAGSTLKDHWDEMTKQMVALGAKQGQIVGVDLTQVKFPRATTIFGMARDVGRNIAKTMYADFSSVHGEIHLVHKDAALPGGPVEVNSQTGMIGSAIQTINGIMVRILINPQIKVMTLIHLNEATVLPAMLTRDIGGDVSQAAGQITPLADDGIYKVLQVNVTGDTRGNPWYMDLSCVAHDTSKIPDGLLMAAGVAKSKGF